MGKESTHAPTDTETIQKTVDEIFVRSDEIVFRLLTKMLDEVKDNTR